MHQTQSKTLYLNKNGNGKGNHKLPRLPPTSEIQKPSSGLDTFLLEIFLRCFFCKFFFEIIKLLSVHSLNDRKRTSYINGTYYATQAQEQHRHTYTHVYLDLYTYIHIAIHTYIPIYVYKYIYIYIYTCTHIYKYIIFSLMIKPHIFLTPPGLHAINYKNLNW